MISLYLSTFVIDEAEPVIFVVRTRYIEVYQRFQCKTPLHVHFLAYKTVSAKSFVLCVYISRISRISFHFIGISVYTHRYNSQCQ